MGPDVEEESCGLARLFHALLIRPRGWTRVPQQAVPCFRFTILGSGGRQLGFGV